MTFTDVGPTWGSQITEKAIIAVLVFFIVVVLYISFRFEWKMAIAALIAVIHDLLDHGRDLFAGRLPGHPGHGDRRPHHPRVLAL